MSKIGLLSDSHGRASTTRRAVQVLLERQVHRIVHLGDIGTVEVIDALVENLDEAGRVKPPVHVVFGNTDWDLDGSSDLLVNSHNVNFLRNKGGEKQPWLFEDRGPVDTRVLAGHTTSPTIVDWDNNNIPDLLVGAEDGHLYYMKNPHDKTSEQP